MPAKIHPELDDNGESPKADGDATRDNNGSDGGAAAFLWATTKVPQVSSWRVQVIDPGNRAQGIQPTVWVRGKKKEVCNRSLLIFTIQGKFRQMFLSLVEWRWFDRFILFLILLNSIMLVLQDYRSDPNHGLNWFLNNVAENTLLVFFFFECIFKVIAWGFAWEKHTYLRDGWNVLDFICVVSALITTASSPPWDDSSGKTGGVGQQLRMFRMLRPLRSLNAVPELKKLVNTVLAALPRLVNVVVLAMFLFTILGVIGITLWGGLFYRQCRTTDNPVLDLEHHCWRWEPTGERVCGGFYDCDDIPNATCGGHIEDPFMDLRPRFPNVACSGSDCWDRGQDMQGFPWCEGHMKKAMPEHDFIHFDHIGGALLIVFQSMTLEGWTDIMYRVQDGGNYWTATIYFFFLVAITSFFLLNVALAVVDESWQELAGDEEHEEVDVMPTRSSMEEGDSEVGEDVVAPENEPWLNIPPVRFMQWIVTSDIFGWVIMFCICGNTIIMSTSSFPMLISFQDTVEFCEAFFLVVFTVEMAMMLFGIGPKKYVTNPVTLFDGIIVSISLASVLSGMSGAGAISVLRVARLLRILNKIASRWSAFKVLLKAMGLTAISLGYWLVLFVLVLYIFTLLAMAFFATKFKFNDTDTFDRTVESDAIAGMPTWKREAWCPGSEEIIERLSNLRMSLPDGTECVPRANFDTFLWAFVTIFQVMSGENWNTIMYAGMRATGWWAVFFFALLILFGQTLFLSLFLTILMSKFDEVQTKLEMDEDKRKNLRSIHKTESKKWRVAQQFTTVLIGKQLKDQLPTHSMSLDPHAQEALPVASEKTNDDKSPGGSPNHHASDTQVEVLAEGPSTYSVGAQADTPSPFKPAAFEAATADHDSALSENMLPGQLGSPRHAQQALIGKQASPTTGPQPPPEEQHSMAEQGGVEPSQDIPLPPSAPTALEPEASPVSGKSSDKNEKIELLGKLNTTPSRNPSSASADKRNKPPSVTSAPRRMASSRGSSLEASEPEEIGPWPHGYAWYIWTRESFVRRACLQIIHHEVHFAGMKMKVFDNVILICILVSSLCMAIDSPLADPEEWLTQLIRTADKVFAVVFILEMLIKLAALGLIFHKGAYLRSGWNWLDAIVVVVSITNLAGAGGGSSALKTLRILRALRPLRVISRNQNLKVVVKTIFASMPELATLVVVALLFLLIWALFILQYLPGMLYTCNTDEAPGLVGYGRDLGKMFTTPLCLDTGLSNSVSANSVNYVNLEMCQRGGYQQVIRDFYAEENDPPLRRWTGEGFWMNGEQSCSAAGCSGSPWKRVSGDTPICIGRCKIGGSAKTSLVGGVEVPLCPASLSRTEELPSLCHAESSPGELYSTFTPRYEADEKKGVEYIWAMQREMVMPCGGNWIDEQGSLDDTMSSVSCRATFCPQVSQDKVDDCRNECKHTKNIFCTDVCQKWRVDGGEKPYACSVCLEECEAACQCSDYCEPLIRDAALCYEQGGKWVDTLQQNFNNLANSMLTLFEILTTEGWVDVMYAACDSTDIYVQPYRDGKLFWAIIFSAWIFFSNMFIINLAVGVVVDNFMELKEKGFMTCLTPSQAKWVNSRRKLWSRGVLFNLTNLQNLPPLRRKVYHMISSKTFEYIIVTTIITNTGTMALELFDAEDWWVTTLDILGYYFSFVFVVEFCLKFYALRSEYWKDSWNRFDCACILTDLLSRTIRMIGGQSMESNPFLPLLRVLRIFRLFRLLRFAKELNKLFMALVISLPKLFNVTGILVLLLILYSILGVNLFATAPFGETLNEHGNFQNFYSAFITLFRASTGEAWNNIMHDLSRDEEDYYREGLWCSPVDLFDTEKKWDILNDKCLIEHPNSCPMLNAWNILPVLYWVTYTLIISFIIMNLVIAVILEGYEEGKACPESEVIDLCIQIWKKYDPNHTLHLPFPDALAYMDEVVGKILHEDWHTSFNPNSQRGSSPKPKELAAELKKGTQGSLPSDKSWNLPLIHIPMKFARLLDITITKDGEVTFLDSTQQILRFSCIGELKRKAPQILVGKCSVCYREFTDPHIDDDHSHYSCRRCGGEVKDWRLRDKTIADMLAELEDSDLTLTEQQPKVAERMTRMKEAQTCKQGSFAKENGRAGKITEHVAAAKVQQAFQQYKMRRQNQKEQRAAKVKVAPAVPSQVAQTKVEDMTDDSLEHHRGESDVRVAAKSDDPHGAPSPSGDALRGTATSEEANGHPPPVVEGKRS